MEEILFLQRETEKVFVHEEIIKAVRNIVWGHQENARYYTWRLHKKRHHFS